MKMPVRCESGANSKLTAYAPTKRAVSILISPGPPRIAAILSGPVEIMINTARLVGAYGVNFEFAPDSHRTGIFTFDRLRELGSTASNTI